MCVEEEGETRLNVIGRSPRVFMSRSQKPFMRCAAVGTIQMKAREKFHEKREFHDATISIK